MKTITINDVEIGTGIPKICVPLTGSTKDQLAEQAALLHTADVHIAEWRVDFFDGIEDIVKVQEALRTIRREIPHLPLIFTFRSLEEGGEKSIEAGTYAELNKTMIETEEIDIVDIELSKSEEVIKEVQAHAVNHNVYSIISSHDFHGTPPKEEIIARMVQAQNLGADLPKIAVMPKEMKDVLTLLAATIELRDFHLDRPVITMSMGKSGVISRLAGEIFGSAVTFGTVQEASAPGQVRTDDLNEILKLIHRIQRQTF